MFSKLNLCTFLANSVHSRQNGVNRAVKTIERDWNLNDNRPNCRFSVIYIEFTLHGLFNFMYRSSRAGEMMPRIIKTALEVNDEVLIKGLPIWAEVISFIEKTLISACYEII